MLFFNIVTASDIRRFDIPMHSRFTSTGFTEGRIIVRLARRVNGLGRKREHGKDGVEDIIDDLVLELCDVHVHENRVFVFLRVVIVQIERQHDISGILFDNGLPGLGRHLVIRPFKALSAQFDQIFPDDVHAVFFQSPTLPSKNLRSHSAQYFS